MNDTERNFSFKVTSPVRVLMLQAEGSLEMQDWLETLNNAITHAIHGASHPKDTPTPKKGGGVNGGRVDGEEEPMPV